MFKKLFGRKKKQEEMEEQVQVETPVQEEVEAELPELDKVEETPEVKAEPLVEDAVEAFEEEEEEVLTTEDVPEVVETVEEVAEEPEEEVEEPKVGFFKRLKKGLSKTRQGFIGKVETLFTGRAIDDEFFEELEEILIQADVGVKTTMTLVERMQEIVDERGIKDTGELREVFKEEIQELLGKEASLLELKPGINILMVVGVNGAGKTTTIAKIAERYKKQNKKLLLAAGDTFRAAAIDQLKVWGNRVGIDVIAHTEGSDAAAVAFDAVNAARSREVDLLIVDTAGRLHTQKNLMEELKKVRRIIEKESHGAHVQTLLVVDSTTGQNAVNQARLFNEAVQVDGIALTKLDGTAKGGVVIAIKDELNIPIKLIGVGEKAEDLQDFHPDEFVQALFDEE